MLDTTNGDHVPCYCESSHCDHEGACPRPADPLITMAYVGSCCSECAATMEATGGAEYITHAKDPNREPTPEGYPDSGSGLQARVDYYQHHGYGGVHVAGVTYLYRRVDGIVDDRITVDREGVMHPGWDPPIALETPAVAGDLACVDCGMDLTLIANPSLCIAHDDACIYADDVFVLRCDASNWHGGQGSCLYAFSSTGVVTIGIVLEVERCMFHVRAHPEAYDPDELSRLGALLRYVSPIEAALVAAPEDGS